MEGPTEQAGLHSGHGIHSSKLNVSTSLSTMLTHSQVWISPVTAQISEAYHGYYQKDLYSVNTNFGSADDLKSLASALHARGMYLMVDVVPNHMGWPGWYVGSVSDLSIEIGGYYRRWWLICAATIQ